MLQYTRTDLNVTEFLSSMIDLLSVYGLQFTRVPAPGVQYVIPLQSH